MNVVFAADQYLPR